MDGAVICDRDATRIVRAAVQLLPDPTIPTDEQGTRHRTAERVAKQTGFPVVSRQQVDAHHRALRRRPSATCSRTPARSCRGPTRRWPPSSATRCASTRSAARCPRSRSRTSSRSATSGSWLSASRWSGASRPRSRLRHRARHRRPPAVPPARRARGRRRVRPRARRARLPPPGRPARPQPRGRPSPSSTRSRPRTCSTSPSSPRPSATPRSGAARPAVSPRGFRLLARVPRLPDVVARPPRRALRRSAEAPRGQHRRPAGRRGRRRDACPLGARGSVAPGRVEHPRALRLT
jgi:hypothetical protein